MSTLQISTKDSTLTTYYTNLFDNKTVNKFDLLFPVDTIINPPSTFADVNTMVTLTYSPTVSGIITPVYYSPQKPYTPEVVQLTPNSITDPVLHIVNQSNVINYYKKGMTCATVTLNETVTITVV